MKLLFTIITITVFMGGVLVGAAIKSLEATAEGPIERTILIPKYDHPNVREQLFIPTYPAVYELDKDLVFEGRIEIKGQGVVGRATFKKGGKIYFKEVKK